MQLGTRFALALLLTTIQFSATSAEDAPKAKVFEELIPFSSDEGLARLARSTAKVDFPVLSPTPRSVDLHRQRLSLMPCTAVIPTFPEIGAACMKGT
jgi:hypothetical protein